MMRQSWLFMIPAVAALSTHTKHCISRRGLAGAVVAAAGIVPKPCAASVDDLPPDALKELFDSILQFARAQDVLYMSLLEQKAAARQHARGHSRFARAAATERRRLYGQAGGGRARIRLGSGDWPAA